MSEQTWIERVEVDQSFEQAPLRWLEARAGEGMPWLLAFCDDGAIWGRRTEEGTFLLSSDVFDDPVRYPGVAVELRAVTLQEAHVFGLPGELRVWRTTKGFVACLVADGEDTIKQRYLLWHQGGAVDPRPDDGFALLQEGQAGQRHAPPVIPKGERPRLVVHHRVEYDEHGQAYVAGSRLVGLEA
jgi:CRISPR-associated protein (TIGR03984 family)